VHASSASRVETTEAAPHVVHISKSLDSGTDCVLLVVCFHYRHLLLKVVQFAQRVCTLSMSE
jgi:hypothetical protein